MTTQLKRRKSSAAVKLVLIGTLGATMSTLAGCSGDKERRDVYANKEACLADWGNEPADCTPAAASSSRGGVGHYYGRSYSHIRGESGPRSSSAIGSEVVGRGGVTSSHRSSSVSRGGFGSSGRSSSG